MGELSINNVINISVSQPGAGLSEYNTSNLAIFTQEAYESSFGSDGYKIYLDPIEVAEDFGTESKTYKMANAIFSQQPNIRANVGYLVVIPMVVEEQLLTFGAIPTAGSFVLNIGGGATAAINWNDSEAQVQTKVRAITGLEQAVVTGTPLTSISILLQGVVGNIALASITSNTIENTGVPVTITPSEVEAGELLPAAITRTASLVQYFGLMATYLLGDSELQASAAVIQPLNKMGFFAANAEADVAAVTGKLTKLALASYSKSRGLLYIDSDEDEVLKYQAAYAGRALSTNFSGSNTTQTMHLKDLIGILPDLDITQNILQKCKDAGADVYISIQGVPKVFCTGGNQFFDDVYNLQWLVGAMEIAGFNVLAQTSTKIAQTEGGVDSLKGAYRKVCEQGLTNQFLAPGRWTSPTTFGDQQDLFQNIEQRGYYIYSQPVALQSIPAREAREAPLIQIAIKYAGAIHSSTVIVNINK